MKTEFEIGVCDFLDYERKPCKDSDDWFSTFGSYGLYFHIDLHKGYYEIYSETHEPLRTIDEEIKIFRTVYGKIESFFKNISSEDYFKSMKIWAVIDLCELLDDENDFDEDSPPYLYFYILPEDTQSRICIRMEYDGKLEIQHIVMDNLTEEQITDSLTDYLKLNNFFQAFLNGNRLHDSV